MKKIKIGNSFDVVYSCMLKDADGNDQPVNFSLAEDVTTAIELSNTNTRTELPSVISGTQIIVSVDSSLLGRTGAYRLDVNFTYGGNEFSRNPKAFELVANVEQEKNCDPCGCPDPCKSTVTDNVDVNNVEVEDDFDIKVVTVLDSVQSDWNEEDETSPAYIKNKPEIPAAQIPADWDQEDDTKPDYIKNKPTIPEEQVQSDWDEEDETKPSFIKNKPDIPTGQAQSDWNQSNDTQPDFIKNKPTKLSEFDNDLEIDAPTNEQFNKAIEALQQSDANEEQERKSADSVLAGEITTERESRESDVSGLSGRIDDEAQSRRDADDTERSEREAGDATLQALIESLHSKANIVDSVPTYADLLLVDTSKLAENSLYIILKDETQEGVTTIYDWNGTEWIFSGTFTVNMVANLVTFTPASGINSTNVQDAIIEAFSKSVKLSSVSTQVIDSDIALAFNCELLGTLEDGTQHVIAAYKIYNAGTPEELIQFESGSQYAHYNTNGIDRPTHETPDGKKEYAFTDDVQNVLDSSMQKSVYDPENTGTVLKAKEAESAEKSSNSDKLEGKTIQDIVNEQVTPAIATHNASTDAHPDIRNHVDQVEAIARGKSRARVFDTVADLDTWLSNPDNVAQLQIGDNFYIKATDVPDYWWDGSEKQPLETEKVDLSGYAKVDGSNAAGTWPISITGNSATAEVANTSNRTKSETKSKTLNPSDWTQVSGLWKATITDAAITGDCEISAKPDISTQKVADAAGIYSDITGDSVSHTFTLTADNQPTAAINVKYSILYTWQ